MAVAQSPHAVGAIWQALAQVHNELGEYPRALELQKRAVAQLRREGNPQMLAEGISEALYNTAGGLLVAIPCIIANNHFRSRVERLIHWTEGCAGEIVRRAHS